VPPAVLLEGQLLHEEVARLAAVLVSILQALIATGLGYHYLLLIGALVGRRNRSAPARHRSFAIAIPAHNEAAVIGRTVSRLLAQDYPSDLFDVYVVADHCSDDTATTARANGAICYERGGGRPGRKAYALQWLLERVLSAEREYDAVVVFDADSQVDASYLRGMNGTLSKDRPVLQGRHIIANPEESTFAALASADMRLNNLLRNQAKDALGLSCRLMGDAMCFACDVLRRHEWPAESLGEDREYGLYLLSHGIPVGYVADAVSVGQAAPDWGAASAQRIRWYGGVGQIRRKYTLRLLRIGLAHGNWAALDQAIELLLPPFSALVLLSATVAVVHLLCPGVRPLLPVSASLGLAAAWIVFPFLGLWVDRAPPAVYRALLYSPLYLTWRLWVGLKANLKRERVQWVRTRRREEVEHHGTEA
jgi:cellulose synthase/poly-beta-1,6-N-acetylglucosamine synthase-like glycosyltransferase